MQQSRQFPPNISKNTVSRRLRKIAELSLIKKTTVAVGRGVIAGYSLTQRGLAKITPTRPTTTHQHRAEGAVEFNYKKPFDDLLILTEGQEWGGIWESNP